MRIVRRLIDHERSVSWYGEETRHIGEVRISGEEAAPRDWPLAGEICREMRFGSDVFGLG